MESKKHKHKDSQYGLPATKKLKSAVADKKTQPEKYAEWASHDWKEAAARKREEIDAAVKSSPKDVQERMKMLYFIIKNKKKISHPQDVEKMTNDELKRAASISYKYTNGEWDATYSFTHATKTLKLHFNGQKFQYPDNLFKGPGSTEDGNISEIPRNTRIELRIPEAVVVAYLQTLTDKLQLATENEVANTYGVASMDKIDDNDEDAAWDDIEKKMQRMEVTMLTDFDSKYRIHCEKLQSKGMEGTCEVYSTHYIDP